MPRKELSFLRMHTGFCETRNELVPQGMEIEHMASSIVVGNAGNTSRRRRLLYAA